MILMAMLNFKKSKQAFVRVATVAKSCIVSCLQPVRSGSSNYISCRRGGSVRQKTNCWHDREGGGGTSRCLDEISTPDDAPLMGSVAPGGGYR